MESMKLFLEDIVTQIDHSLTRACVIICLICMIAPLCLDLIGFPPVTLGIRYVRWICLSFPFHVVLLGIFIARASRTISGIDDSLIDLVLNQLNTTRDVVNVFIEKVESPLTKGFLYLLKDIGGFTLILCLFRMLNALYNFEARDLKKWMTDSIVDSLSNLSFVKEEMRKETNKMKRDLRNDLKDPNRVVNYQLPKTGISENKLIADLEISSSKENKKWEDGLVSGTVYSGEAYHTKLLNRVYAAYSLSNPLHTDIWPSVNQMEAEVVAMTASLVGNGNTTVVGCTSSGGTESIFLAAKAHREYFRKKYNILSPEIVSCTTAHAGIDKACEILGIKNVKVGFTDDFVIDMKQVKSAITSNTIMIYGSAPNFPQGVIDPIEELSTLAIKYDIGLHVDCCLGGFILPFAKRLGFDIPPFDFSLPGVTSMSCDTHKYGYAAKGTSVVLYKHEELRRAQYFTYPDWSGGLYATPTLAGSRPGALIACAWASLMALGEDGFMIKAKKIMETTQRIAEKISSIKGIKVIGDTKAMIVCFASDELNIYRVGDAMAKLGWSLNSLQNPSCIHLCVTIPVAEKADRFVYDLTQVVNELLQNDKNETAKGESGTAAMYGKVGSLPTGPVSELLKSYLDIMLTP